MRRYWRIAVSLSMMGVAACGADSNGERERPAAAQEPADWVISGGRIFTVDDQNPWAEAVAVKGDEFVFVGDEAPDFSYLGLNTGETHTLSDQFGKVVLLSYFGVF